MPKSLSALPMRSKLVVGAVTLVILLVAFFMIRLAMAPSYTTMLSGLDPAETGKVTTALDELGIPYELQSGGTALAVVKADQARARIALAGEGLAGGASGTGTAPGYELFDTQKLGASDLQQKITLLRALEGEIGKTLNGVQGVSNAQVSLVMPDEDLFADDSTPATAAVALGNPGDALEAGAVKGMAQLVASSVKGLKPANVTITDSAGQVLWPSSDATGGAGGGSMKAAAEARYARSLETKLNAMLTQTLGPGKAAVQVQADLDMDKTVRNELRYGRRGIPITTDTETETLEGQGAGRAGGTAGAGGNIPTYGAGGSAAGGDSNYEREADKTMNGVDKTVSKTDVAQGTVQKLNIALVLDESVAPAGAAGDAVRNPIRDTVSTAAGFDQARGDTITASSLAFAKPPAAAPPAAGLPIPPALLGPLKWVGLVLAMLLFLFFMRRFIKKREADALPQPAWLAQIDQPLQLGALGAGDPTRVLDSLPDREVEPGLHRLEQLMDREPERVAAQVRQWMDED